MTPSISRRRALRTLATGAAYFSTVAALSSRLAAADAASGLKGRIHHSVCRWCYHKLTLDQLCQAARELGLTAIDLVGPEDWPTLRKYGLACGMANGADTSPKFGWNRLENHGKLIQSYGKLIPLVAAAGIGNLICLSGKRQGMSDEAGWANCTAGLRQIMPLAEKHGVNLCLEMLNSEVDHKDYMADTTAWAVELARRVGSGRFKLLYDIYHMQIMEGNVIDTIRTYHSYFAHYHTGGVPGRHEIDETQELNYAAIMRAIADTGYTGFVAQEFKPSRPDILGSLKQAVGICDV